MQYSTTLKGNEPIVITIGNFDGIHKGHQDLLHATSRLAEQLNSHPVMLTFAPHTLKVVRPEIDLHCLTTLDEKLALAKELGGIADAIVVSFTPEVAAITAGEVLYTLRARFDPRRPGIRQKLSLGHNRL